MRLRRLFSVVLAVSMLLLVTGSALADKPVEFDSEGNEIGWAKTQPSSCTRIQEGSLTYSAGHYLEGEPLTTGYDPYGYNYQAHMFKGSYANAYLGGYGYPPYTGDDEAYLAENSDAEGTWVWPYRNVELLMKWNDAWLANTDCNGDGTLDRHYGQDSYIGSGAWETNHMLGSYNQWNLVRDWELDFYVDGEGPYHHWLTVAVQTDEVFTGEGNSERSDGYNLYDFEGSTSDDDVTFTADYYEPSSMVGYSYTANGTIAPDGSMAGMWSGEFPDGRTHGGTWSSVTGSATATACEWDSFTKIVAVPADATTTDDVWYNSDGTEIGPTIWGEFAVIQDVYNDPCAGIEGVQYLSPDHAGFGGW
jgi:hypothetical protein